MNTRELMLLWKQVHPRSGYTPTAYDIKRWKASYSDLVIEQAIRSVDSTGSPQKVLRALESRLLLGSCVEPPVVPAQERVFTEEERTRFLREFDDAAAKRLALHAPKIDKGDVMTWLDSIYESILEERGEL